MQFIKTVTLFPLPTPKGFSSIKTKNSVPPKTELQQSPDFSFSFFLLKYGKRKQFSRNNILMSYFVLLKSHRQCLHATSPCMTAHVPQEPAIQNNKN